MTKVRGTTLGVPRAAAPLSALLLLRFVIAGGFNTLFHAFVFWLLVLATEGVPGGWLVAAGWVVAMPVAYVVQSRLVWHKPLSFRGLAKLTISCIPGFLASTGLAFVVGGLGGSYFWQELAGLGAVAVLGFTLQRYWVYRE